MSKKKSSQKQQSRDAKKAKEISDFENAIGAQTKKSEFQLQYGAFLLGKYIKEFFTGPPKQKVQHTTFADTAETLIDILSADEDNNTANNRDILEESKQLLDQQKTTDDTWARRRLERWATRLIAFYLIVVFFLVLARGYINVCCLAFNQFISDQVMIVILSTTTINIIGLGVIVLKGHFYNNNQAKKKKNGFI